LDLIFCPIFLTLNFKYGLHKRKWGSESRISIFKYQNFSDFLNVINRTKDGFGRTGDLGHYREDGVLCFNARLKDLIKYQGNHLYPKELEMIIQKHPGVAEVVVFGIPDPDVQVKILTNED